MLSNDILVELISRIRGSPFLKKYSNILKQTPRIYVNFVENKGIELHNISFNNWDEICISNTEITFYPEHSGAEWPSPPEVILSYKNWEELCAIFNMAIN